FPVIPRPPQTPTLCPYTTLFRAQEAAVPGAHGLEEARLVRHHLQALRGDVVVLGRRRQLHGRGGSAGAGLERLVEGAHELPAVQDRKSTRLNSSHVKISYAVFCL